MTERWLVCGGRDFSDFRFLVDTLDALVKKRGTPDVIISGGQRTKLPKSSAYIGADHFAEEWARFNGIPMQVFPIADHHWKQLGKSAGPARNSKMILFGRPTHCVAFAGGSGTADMVKQSKKAKIKVIEPKKVPNVISPSY